MSPPWASIAPLRWLACQVLTKSREFNGATNGATAESRRHGDRMNTGSATDWEVMIEYVTGIPGRSRTSQKVSQSNPSSLI